MSGEQYETLSNNKLAICFDSSNGELVSIRNLQTGNEYLNETVDGGSPFAVYYDFSRDYEITAPPGVTPNTGDDPAEISRRVFSPATGAGVSFAREEDNGTASLMITYEDPLGPWVAELTVTLPAGAETSRWRMKLTNASESPQPGMVVFPYISGLKLAEGKKSLMVFHGQAGFIVPLWSREGGIYGNSSQMTMQWGCVFDDISKDAFAFIVRDAALRNKDIRYLEPSVQVRYFPAQTIAAGETVQFPEVDVMVYTGDWKPAAVAYHDWFCSVFTPVDHPQWVRKIDSHLGQWFKKRGQQFGEESGAGLANPMDSFEELPDVYRRLPVDTIEFAFFCQQSMGEDITGKRFVHTDGINTVREDLGGARMLKVGVDRVHDLGCHLTLYVEGFIVPQDSDLALEGKAREWAYMNKDGTNEGGYTKKNWLMMCPGCKEWQDHLAATCARLVRETGVDGIRLDSLGMYFFPCYNPAHKHDSPFDFNKWMCELLAKVAAAVHKEKPDALLTTEGGSDFYVRYFNGTLAQIWSTERIVVGRDVAVMRVALPEYFVMVHSPNGSVAASLMGLPGGSGGMCPGGYMSELDEKWRSARHAVADVIRWGDAAHDNPAASRKDVVCRRFSGEGLDVIVGARPRYQSDQEIAKLPPPRRQVAYNADVTVQDDEVTYEITVDTGGRVPAHVYLYNVINVSAREIEFQGKDGCIAFSVDANWFMAIMAYDDENPLALVDFPASLKAGETCEVELSLLGAQSGLEYHGRLEGPGLGWSLPVTLPGSVQLAIPEDTAPGKYIVNLFGDRFLGCKRFLEVS